MARKLLKRLMPDPESIRKRPGLKFLGKLLHDPNLFHLNRHSVSVAAFVGVFTSFLPLPGQMLIAAGLALLARCNLPLSIVLVWISNPLTILPIFATTTKLGTIINKSRQNSKVTLMNFISNCGVPLTKMVRRRCWLRMIHTLCWFLEEPNLKVCMTLKLMLKLQQGHAKLMG